MYQLARHRQAAPLWQSGNGVLLDLYLHGYEHAHRYRDLRWHVTYVRKDAHFSRRAHYDFAAELADDLLASVFPFRAMEDRCSERRTAGVESTVPIGSATDSEIGEVLRVLGGSRPLPYVQAYDLVPDRFDLAAVKEEWARAGLPRDRQVLVAREGGQAVAAVVMDLVAEGTYLVGLADAVRTVELKPGGQAHFGALLAAARMWYREHGKQKYILFEETGQPHYALEAGLSDLGEADHTFFSIHLFPEFIENIFQFIAPKPLPLR
jgi:hypothetical protein